MKTLLAINTSINGENSQSNQLVSQFLKQFQQNHVADIRQLDLASEQLPHLTSEEMGAWMTPESERTDKQVTLASLSDNYIAQLESADIVVLGLPMYNFGIPSLLKAWIDRVARAGKTFRYTENGPQGLLTGKKAYILATRGGMYQGTPMDTQTDFIRNVLAFIGIKDVEFVYAEGLAMGEESANAAKSNAEKKIVELISKHAA